MDIIYHINHLHFDSCQNISSTFSRNSEASASEFLENVDEMLLESLKQILVHHT